VVFYFIGVAEHTYRQLGLHLVVMSDEKQMEWRFRIFGRIIDHAQAMFPDAKFPRP
jgi:hypothetical protein